MYNIDNEWSKSLLLFARVKPTKEYITASGATIFKTFKKRIINQILIGIICSSFVFLFLCSIALLIDWLFGHNVVHH